MKTIKDERMNKISKIRKGCWVNLENPTKREIKEIAEKLKIQKDWLYSSIDIDEEPRIEVDKQNVLIVVRVPCKSDEKEIKTMPVGIIVKNDMIVTVSLEPNLVIDDIKNNIVNVYTTQRVRFVLKFLERASYYYDNFIHELAKMSEQIEDMLTRSLSNEEIYKLLIIQKTLIYFSSATFSNEIVFEKIRSSRVFKLYENDVDLIEDIILLN